MVLCACGANLATLRNTNKNPFTKSLIVTLTVVAVGNYRYVLTVVDEGGWQVLCPTPEIQDGHLDRDVATEIQSLTQNKVLQWTFDRGTEFLNSSVKSYARNELHATLFYSNVERPWENGLAERSFGVLFGTARAMLHDAECPLHLWGYAIQHAAYIRIRRPSKKFGGESSMHNETGQPQDLTELRTFGCPAMKIYVRFSERGRYPN